MIALWWCGLLRVRGARLAAVASGIAVAVALLACLGVFLANARATMTARSVAGVPVDWQVQVQPGQNPMAVLDAVRAAPGTRQALPVGYGRADALSATTGTTTQTTGAAVVLGLPDGYRSAFPGEIRTLAGADSGVLLAQQTAANLAVAPGDSIELTPTGGASVPVRVDGVVDLPVADSLFQTVGAPPGSQPSAPPDNVLLLPEQRWHDLFAPPASSAEATSDGAHTQVHVTIGHDLPADPATAYAAVIGAAHNLEARTAGTGVVGNNLGAALDAARGDAAYAQILFLFLGVPGAVLAALLTAAVTGAGAPRRRREQALLRVRGASAQQVLGLAAVEAATVGIGGGLAGLGAAAELSRVALGGSGFGAGRDAFSWIGASFLIGLAIAGLAVLMPAWRDQRSGVPVERPGLPVWARFGIDVLLLVLAGAVFWLAGQDNYELVLAPEGVPTIAVSYWAFAGPGLLWLGTGLLGWRLAELALGPGRGAVTRLLRPISGNLAGTVASTLSRRRREVARSAVLLGLALSFAVSTATFNATYRQQAEVDAKLTNGADVNVTESPGAHVGPDASAALAAVPGVRAVEPVQHRFGYVGVDLQDVYGVRPTTIIGVTALQDAYFQGGSARALMDTLAAQPDSILVSAETVKDFQLHPGDLLNLRLPNARTGQLSTVGFHYVGVVNEFPTAPKDSFLVANADYLAASTGSDAVGAFLVDTGGSDAGGVAQRIRGLLGPGPTVTDIAQVRGRIGSSLTSVDLTGLTRVELGFALVLAAAAGGLVLALGLGERRRSFAIARALGADRRQLRGFVVGEGAAVTAGGLLIGVLGGGVLSLMLVAVLTGVFDPPPSALAVPWPYLAVVVLLAGAGIAIAVLGIVRAAWRAGTEVIRELP
jgi:putative ABC transport system permease protein